MNKYSVWVNDSFVNYVYADSIDDAEQIVEIWWMMDDFIIKVEA